MLKNTRLGKPSVVQHNIRILQVAEAPALVKNGSSRLRNQNNYRQRVPWCRVPRHPAPSGIPEKYKKCPAFLYSGS